MLSSSFCSYQSSIFLSDIAVWRCSGWKGRSQMSVNQPNSIPSPHHASHSPSHPVAGAHCWGISSWTEPVGAKSSLHTHRGSVNEQPQSRTPGKERTRSYCTLLTVRIWVVSEVSLSEWLDLDICLLICFIKHVM